MTKSLVAALTKSIGSEVFNIAGDFLEVGVDTLCNDGLLRDIPFVSTVASLFNIGHTIHDRHSLLKLASFIKQINQSIVDEEEKEKYRIKFENQEKIRDQELAYLLIIIDRYIGVDRPKMLAKLYLAYLRGELLWDELINYAEVLDRLLPSDYLLLSEGDIEGVNFKELNSGYLRLVALGLMVDHGSGTGINMDRITVISSISKKYSLTEFGRKMRDILII